MNEIFPALVTLADGTVIDTARVVDYGGAVTVWCWSAPMRRAVIAAEGTGLSRNGLTYGFRDDDGGLVKVLEQDGCGCGHPMKHFRPPRQR